MPAHFDRNEMFKREMAHFLDAVSHGIAPGILYRTGPRSEGFGECQMPAAVRGTLL